MEYSTIRLNLKINDKLSRLSVVEFPSKFECRPNLLDMIGRLWIYKDFEILNMKDINGLDKQVFNNCYNRLVNREFGEEPSFKEINNGIIRFISCNNIITSMEICLSKLIESGKGFISICDNNGNFLDNKENYSLELLEYIKRGDFSSKDIWTNMLINNDYYKFYCFNNDKYGYYIKITFEK